MLAYCPLVPALLMFVLVPFKIDGSLVLSLDACCRALWFDRNTCSCPSMFAPHTCEGTGKSLDIGFQAKKHLSFKMVLLT